MEFESLAAALEREHHQIDEGIETFDTSRTAADRDTKPLRDAIQALRRHIYLEEEFLFPPLREAGLVAPIFVMLREHGQMWQTLDALERELDTGATDGTGLLLRQLIVQLQHHNLKEEKIIYPQADHVLAASANADLKAFVATGKLPATWVCEKARS